MTYTIFGSDGSCRICNLPISDDNSVKLSSSSKKITGRNGATLMLSRDRAYSSCTENDKSDKDHEVFVTKIKFKNYIPKPIPSSSSYVSCFFGGLTTSVSQILTTGTLKTAALVFSFFSIVSADAVTRATALNKYGKINNRKIVISGTIGSLGLAGVFLLGNPFLFFSAFAGICTTSFTALSERKIKVHNLKETDIKSRTTIVGATIFFVTIVFTNFLVKTFK